MIDKKNIGYVYIFKLLIICLALVNVSTFEVDNSNIVLEIDGGNTLFTVRNAS